MLGLLMILKHQTVSAVFLLLAFFTSLTTAYAVRGITWRKYNCS